MTTNYEVSRPLIQARGVYSEKYSCRLQMYNMCSEVVCLMREYTWTLLLLSILECHNFRCYVIGQ